MKRVQWIRFSVTGRDAAEEEVRAELEEHYRGTVALLIARGWSEEAARAEVRRRFGDERSYRAELEGLARRRARRRRLRALLIVSADAFRSALREARRNPGPSIGVALILAVGIGVNGAVFRVIDRLLLSPPPHVVDASQVRRLHQTVRYGTNAPQTFESFTYGDVRALRTAGAPVSVAAVMLGMPETLGAGEDAVRVRVARVDSAYLPLLGVPIGVGRTLRRYDHEASAAPVAVLGHALWMSRFGGDPAVIGRTVRLAQREYQVVGVMPRDFAGAQRPAADVWLPLEPDARVIWGADWEENRRILAFHILVRLPERVGGTAWTARMESVLESHRSGKDPPGELLALAASSLAPGSGPDPGVMVSVSRWLAAVSLLVLLVACANAANLFLAHGERNRRATAVRIALGAGAGVLRLEQLARSLILALLGGMLSVLAAVWGGWLLEALFLETMELPTRPDMGRLLVYTGGIAVLASLLCGAIPALRAPRGDVRPVLEKGARVVGGGGRVRRALVCVQVALCMLLLVGAGLFVGSFRSALDVDLGFDYERLLMVSLEQEPGSERPRAALYEDAAQRLSALPEVSSSAVTVGVPFVLLYGLSGGLPGQEDLDELYVNAVGSEFFRTMGLQIVRGRPLEPADQLRGARSVVVVSDEAAARLWPGQNPLGRCLRIGDETACAEVVGVATGHQGVSWQPGGLIGTDVPQAWVSTGHPEANPPAALMVRTALPPGRALHPVRRAAAEVSGVRFVEAAAMEDFVASEMRSWRVGAEVFSLFGAIALAIAAAGLYGVLALDVAQRRREYGVRRALGAGRMHVMTPVMASAAPMVATGLLIGAVAAFAGASRLGDLLFRVSPFEPRVFAAAAGVLILVSIVSMAVPAWRAAGVDPREALAEN